MTSGGGFKGLSTSNNAPSSTAAETAAAVKRFTALGVCDQLAEAAAALGWTAPTEIQAAAVPHLLAGELEEEERTEKERGRHSFASRRRLELVSILLLLLLLSRLTPFFLSFKYPQARTSSAWRRPGAARRGLSPCRFSR